MKEFEFTRDVFGQYFEKFEMLYRYGIISLSTINEIKRFLIGKEDIRDGILKGFRYFPNHIARRFEFVYLGPTEHDLAPLLKILSAMRLTRLEINGSRISGMIDLSNCITLGFVSITNCRLDIVVSTLIRFPRFMTFLSLEGNELEDIPNLRKISIKTLLLKNNRLASIETRKIPQTVDILDLSDNKLSIVEELDLALLTDLTFDNNQLVELPRLNNNLQHLMVNDNELTEIPIWIASLNLQTLEVKGNPLRSDWFKTLDIADIVCDEIVYEMVPLTEVV